MNLVMTIPTVAAVICLFTALIAIGYYYSEQNDRRHYERKWRERERVIERLGKERDNLHNSVSKLEKVGQEYRAQRSFVCGHARSILRRLGQLRSQEVCDEE